jgi:CDP-diacylglycerol--serine O-phosphatidyltransferase
MTEPANHELDLRADRLASLLTVGNLFFGYISILSSARGSLIDLDIAAKAIGWAVLFDGLDGRVARLRKVASPFGKELDSLADVISFGVAPAFLALVWGLRGLNLEGPGNPDWLPHLYQAGWIICFAFLICGAWRLARFNIQSAPTDNPGLPAHRYFIGMPIPAAAGLLAATVHAIQKPLHDWRWAIAWLALVAALALLMISPIRYPSFKEFGLGRSRRSLIGIAILVASIWFYSRPVLLLLAAGYFFSGPLGVLRRRAFGHPA